jgi:hypothetical protein
MMTLKATNCPTCKKAMRKHCGSGRCGWMFCAPCGLTFDPKTGRAIGIGGK